MLNCLHIIQYTSRVPFPGALILKHSLAYKIVSRCLCVDIFPHRDGFTLETIPSGQVRTLLHKEYPPPPSELVNLTTALIRDKAALPGVYLPLTTKEEEEEVHKRNISSRAYLTREKKHHPLVSFHRIF